MGKMTPLVSCVNGCPRPPQPPSAVLCAPCFAALDVAVRTVVAMLGGKASQP